jgi:hypothetical protein
VVGAAGRDGDGAGDDLVIGIDRRDIRERLVERFVLGGIGLGDGSTVFGKLGIEELVGDARTFAGPVAEGDEGFSTLLANVRLLKAHRRHVADRLAGGGEGVAEFDIRPLFQLRGGFRIEEREQDENHGEPERSLDQKPHRLPSLLSGLGSLRPSACWSLANR